MPNPHCFLGNTPNLQVRRCDPNGKIITADGTMYSSRAVDNCLKVGCISPINDDADGNRSLLGQFKAVERILEYPIPSSRLRVYTCDNRFTEAEEENDDNCWRGIFPAHRFGLLSFRYWILGKLVTSLQKSEQQFPFFSKARNGVAHQNWVIGLGQVKRPKIFGGGTRGLVREGVLPENTGVYQAWSHNVAGTFLYHFTERF